jgi:hypothetical protein
MSRFQQLVTQHYEAKRQHTQELVREAAMVGITSSQDVMIVASSLSMRCIILQTVTVG